MESGDKETTTVISATEPASISTSASTNTNRSTGGATKSVEREPHPRLRDLHPTVPDYIRQRYEKQWDRSAVQDQCVYKSTCGYCRGSARTSVAHGLEAYSLTVQDYQELLDRGWRRSGLFLYKPHMKSTCCPPYTIRLKAESFVPSKDQRRVLRRMERHLEGTLDGPRSAGEIEKEKEAVDERIEGSTPNGDHQASVSNRKAAEQKASIPTDANSAEGAVQLDHPAVTKEEEAMGLLKVSIESNLMRCIQQGLLPSSLDPPPSVPVKHVPSKVKGKLKQEAEKDEAEVDYTSTIAFAVSALWKRISKREAQQAGDDPSHQEPKTTAVTALGPQEIAEMLAGKLAEESIGVLDFIVTSSRGYLNFASRGRTHHSSDAQAARTSQTRSKKRDGVISKDGPVEALVPAPVAALRSPPIQLETRLKRSSFDAEEFALYQKYQVRVHNDSPEGLRENSYRRFLVDSPLIFQPPSEEEDGTTPSCGFGSFHQQYLMNGKLIAVGVIDILPKCLSSKYLFWDPDLAFLGLGKYTAMREIGWVREAQKTCPSLQYYYLGFYIHSCAKMRYKAAYHPSELLCPERFSWVSYERAVPFLDKHSYVCLSDIPFSPPSNSAAAPGAPPTGESLSPGVKRKQETAVTSGPDSEDDEDEDDLLMEMEADFSEVEDPEKLDRSLELLLEKETPRSDDDSTEQLGEIQIFVDRAGYMTFKHLREQNMIRHKWILDAITRNLKVYLEDVGPSLASRIAYMIS